MISLSILITDGVKNIALTFWHTSKQNHGLKDVALRSKSYIDKLQFKTKSIKLSGERKCHAYEKEN